MEEHFWKTVVEHWGVHEYSETHPKALQFSASVNKSKTVKFGSVVNFAVINVTIDGMVYHPICPCGRDCHISTLCGINCDDYNLNELISKPSLDDKDVYQMSQFWVFLLLMVVGWIGQAIAVSIGDAICFEMLGEYFI